METRIFKSDNVCKTFKLKYKKKIYTVERIIFFSNGKEIANISATFNYESILFKNNLCFQKHEEKCDFNSLNNFFRVLKLKYDKTRMYRNTINLYINLDYQDKIITRKKSNKIDKYNLYHYFYYDINLKIKTIDNNGRTNDVILNFNSIRQKKLKK